MKPPKYKWPYFSAVYSALRIPTLNQPFVSVSYQNQNSSFTSFLKSSTFNNPNGFIVFQEM